MKPNKYTIQKLERGESQHMNISRSVAQSTVNNYGKRFGMLFLVHLYGDKVFIKRVR